MIWQLPRKASGSHHGLKYRLFYGYPGLRLVGYDNETGKDDHRHLGNRKEQYHFTTAEQLIADFLAEMRM